jgi:rhomboid family GlyGly-CTERM serine protease
MIQPLRSAIRSPALWLAISLGVLCFVLQTAGLEEQLRFDRSKIDNGDWWLLLTGNFVHLGMSHLWMNLAGFALVVSLVWSHFNVFEWLIVILLSSLVVGIGLWQLDPDVGWYVGFSGTLHGLIIAGSLADLKTYPRSAAILLLLVVAKLGWEQFAGALPGSESVAGGSVVVNAHLYGAIAGAVIGVLLLLRQRLGQIPKKSEKPSMTRQE